ncbi:winged helix-turn-helix domain-containing protein [Actinomadura barringtoniae]|uniref:Winged helix-turn-helix domain-containing protein n=1 Tax=Actinomadura barringtoniae TaxID=1427535 RepID=A0A939PEQ6_9ACTN|nr:BTAD domain-containing putative transcriptional regulator [Actinomadura barringtoniae]MBO2451256.1 winged helix-turn-helix domain-containing protein [Actinomadura barringtoniae]
MQFGILGPVEALVDGRPVAVGGPRVRALLALLLLDAGRLVSTERLIDGLYGEDPPSGAANALQSQVSRLRRGLGDAELVEGQPAGYRLAVDPADVDVHRFDRLVREGRQALPADPAKAAALLREALGLWRGPALADLTDAPFAKAQAARLEEQRVAAAEDRAEAELAVGEHAAVVAPLQELTAEHPLRERAQGLLMRALYGSGRQAEALAAYENVRQLLADELGADPSAELSEIHMAILRGDESLRAVKAPAPAPAAAPAVFQSNLPAQLTSFVGREEELARVGKMLEESRLVTLLGPGGTGKTRLAVEAGGRAEGEVCFADLSPVMNEDDLPQAMLTALGVREAGLHDDATQGERPQPLDRLIMALADRPMLLILDNLEQVVAGAARLTHRLLSACPSLRVLATSREALGVTGETIWPLPPLRVPEPGTAAAEALAYPAVRLFADRAAAVRPGFEVDEGNARTVLQICAALDGLPLAIELAAARLRSMAIEDVAARLDDRFRLLTRGNRSAAPRHQTLRAVVEWSWELLDEDEQQLARRLTVFAGGATLEAAERVCGLPEYETDDLLASLTDKSLIQNDGGRYRMLETVRAFCAERLADTGEEDELRRAHTAYFVDLAETADPKLRGPDQLTWMARLTAEHANTQAAFRWAITSEPETALRLLGALSWYWWLRGMRGEVGAPAAELLEHFGPRPPEGLDEEYVLCVVNAGAGGMLTKDADAHMSAAAKIMDAMPGAPRRISVLVLWAMSNPIPNADDMMERRRRMLTLAGDPWLDALDDFSASYMAMYSGDLDTARPHFEKAISSFRALGDRWGIANTLDGFAMLAELQGDLPRCLELIDQAYALTEELGVPEDMADLLCRKAETFIRSGDLDAGRAEYERAHELAVRAGSPQRAQMARRGLADIARMTGDLATARALYEEILNSRTLTWGWTAETVARAHLGLGLIALGDRELSVAREHFREAIGISWEQPYVRTASEAVAALAEAALLLDDAQQAATLLGAIDAFREIGPPLNFEPLVARIRESLGEDAYESAYAQGAAMPRQEAFAFARS